MHLNMQKMLPLQLTPKRKLQYSFTRGLRVCCQAEGKWSSPETHAHPGIPEVKQECLLNARESSIVPCLLTITLSFKRRMQERDLLSLHVWQRIEKSSHTDRKSKRGLLWCGGGSKLRKACACVLIHAFCLNKTKLWNNAEWALTVPSLIYVFV